MTNDCCIYLRKSRVDIEAEAHGEGDTLLRHRTRLLALAKAMHVNIGRIYEEGVKSGETITSRPVMQELLHDVECGMWAGVFVMEVERLARGDTIDQGIVSRAFQYSGTLIITPAKTYNPASEFDQEYFEFGLFMSRREYKTINRRQQQGRIASVNEGKWPANRAPYGYDRLKLERQKGWTLTPNEQAPVVADIFRWFTQGAPGPDGSLTRLGSAKICRRLNDAGIPSPNGTDWSPWTVKFILTNPAYAGWVRWGHRPQKKQLDHGNVVYSRPRLNPGDVEMHLAKGLHPPIVTQEEFDQAQKLLSGFPAHPGPKQAELRNPLAGLIICGGCGRAMVRRPYPNHPDGLLCPHTSCPTKSSDLAVVETAVLQALARWLTELEHTPDNAPTESEAAERASLTRSIASLERELTQIGDQEQRAYDLVEQRVYTVEVFTARCRELSTRRGDVGRRLEQARLDLADLEHRSAERSRLAPAVRHVMDSYPMAATPKEKNDLLRSVLTSVTYTKTTGGRYRESNMAITLHPRIPF